MGLGAAAVPFSSCPAGTHLFILPTAVAGSISSFMNHKTLWRAGRVYCPLCVCGATGRASFPGHYGFVAVDRKERGRWMSSMKRRERGSSSSPGVSPLSGGDWSKWYPALCEFLSMHAWEDGTARATGTVMLLSEDGRWKAWVHDRDSLEGLFVSGSTPDAVLSSVEALLVAGDGEWRPDKRPSKRG